MSELSSAREQTASYLKALTAGAAPSTWVEVTLNRCKKGVSFPCDPAGLNRCVASIEQWDALESEMHIGAAPRWRKPTGNNGRAVEADVSATPWLWVDIDLPGAQELLDGFPIPPTMVVASGRPGHRQAYWRLEEPASKEDAKPAMQLLAAALQGDGVQNMDRVMRCPGTTSRKPEAGGAVVEIVSQDDRRVPLSDLLSLFAETAPDVAIPTPTPDAEEWDQSKDELLPPEVERLDRVTRDTPAKDRSKIKEHARRKIAHARSGMTNAASADRGYGAQQLLGVARDIGRCLGGGLAHADATRMLQDFEAEMGATTDEHRKNNARAIRRGLAQGADKPWRPGSGAAPVSQDQAGGLRTYAGRTVVATMGDEGPSEALFMDGAIEVVGVVGTEEAGVNEAYEILLTIGDRQLEQYLEIADLANPQRFRAWCLARGLATFIVPNATPPGLGADQRLNRFLLSQGAKTSIVIPNLGWHPATQCYLTVEGRITKDGFVAGHDGVRPHPHLIKNGLTAHRYGATRSVDEARAALREILTWQHPMTSAIMGSWWATTFLKNHIRLAAGDGLYPFLGLEGNSGTGRRAACSRA